MNFNKRLIGNCSFALMSALLLSKVNIASAQITTAPVETTVAPAPVETTVSQTSTETTAVLAAPVETTSAPTETTVAGEKDTVILHTNDIHGRMEEQTNKDGSTSVLGMAKLDALVEQERAKADQNTILLDAGDAFQGLPISNISKGEEMAKLMNQVGYDAMAVGNHEFDFGLDQVNKLSELLTFPLLSSNTYVNGARLFDASTIIDKDKNVVGDEVVVIGVTTPETTTKTHPNNIQGITFKDPMTEVLSVIKEIEGKATAEGKTYNNYVILGHLGVDGSTQDAWRGDKMLDQLANNAMLATKNLVFLDGHSHTERTTFVKDNVVYQQTGTNLNKVGKVTLKSGSAIEAELIAAEEAGKLTATPEMEAAVEAAKAVYKQETSDVLVENNNVHLEGVKENVRTTQTNLGDLITDAMLEYSKTGFSQPSDLAVTNGGGIRSSIEAGKPIIEEDVITVLPFGNIIAQIEVTGQQIQEMFKHALSAPNAVNEDTGEPIYFEDFAGLNIPKLAAAGNFLHISGARVFYDAKAEKVEDRNIIVEIMDPKTGEYKPLDLERVYRVTTNDFLAVGGDGYEMLGGNREEGPSLDTVVSAFIKTQEDLSKYEGSFKFDRVIPFAKADLEEVLPEEDKESGDSKEDDKKEESKDKKNSKKSKKPTKKSSSKTSEETLPETGESDNLVIFGAAALSILAGLGLAGKVKIEEN